MEQGTVDMFEDESVDAARDLLRLFTRAKTFVPESRMIRRASEIDSQPLLAEMRRRLADAIIDDSLLFDDKTMISLFEFFSAWRKAAFECDLEKEAAVDEMLESSYHAVAVRLEARLALPGPSR